MDIFAGSLPFKLKENELKELFEKYGEVTSAKIIIDKETRQNKGFGFVVMPNDDEALKAIEALNGFEVMGRQIKVNKSEKREPSSGPNGGNSFRGNGERRPSFNDSSKSDVYKKEPDSKPSFDFGGISDRSSSSDKKSSAWKGPDKRDKDKDRDSRPHKGSKGFKEKGGFDKNRWFADEDDE